MANSNIDGQFNRADAVIYGGAPLAARPGQLAEYVSGSARYVHRIRYAGDLYYWLSASSEIVLTDWPYTSPSVGDLIASGTDHLVCGFDTGGGI